jgi:hypothetical protein
METLSIESKKPFSLELIRVVLSKHWRVDLTAADLSVHGTGSRAYLHLDNASKEHGLRTLLMDYSDVELAKSLVEKIADDPTLTVDNDFGTILPGDEFVARIQSDRNWNWRDRKFPAGL